MFDLASAFQVTLFAVLTCVIVFILLAIISPWLDIIFDWYEKYQGWVRKILRRIRNKE